MLDEPVETNLFDELLRHSICRLGLLDADLAPDEEPRLMPSFDGDQRRYPRYRLHNWAVLEYRTTFPALERPAEFHAVYTVDISRGSLGFLHSAQVFPRERMRIVMPSLQPRWFEVVRCQVRRPNVYHVGGRFVADPERASSEAPQAAVGATGA